jgi:hypothetical protein
MGMAKTKTKNGEKSASTPFNVNASLARLEKKYDELTKANNVKTLKKDNDDDDGEDDTMSSSSSSLDDVVTTEYVVAARAPGHVADWVPIAQFCVARTASQAATSDGAADPLLRAAVSYHCRELSHVATLGSRVFQSVPRNLLQYAVETLDSFHKHVYEPAVQGKNDDVNNDNVMTKQEARLVLNLVNGDGDDKSEIKRSYRALSFEWHPDRFVGTERSPQEIADAVERYSRIKLAYDTLNSGVRDVGKSWYQSLGGKARTDFIGPLQLLPLDAAKQLLEADGVATALSGMCPKIVQGFVARSQQ